MAEIELVEKRNNFVYLNIFWADKDSSQDSEQVICRLCQNSVVTRGITYEIITLKNMWMQAKQSHQKESERWITTTNQSRSPFKKVLNEQNRYLKRAKGGRRLRIW